MELKKISLILLLTFALTACEEDASVSELSEGLISKIAIEESPQFETTPEATPGIDVIDDPIEIEGVSDDDEESSDEVLSDDETNQEPEDTVVSEGEATPGSDSGNSGEETQNDDTPVAEDETVEDETLEDENNDELCRQRGNLILNGSFEVSDDRKGLRGKKLSSLNSKNWDVFKSLPSKNIDQESWYTSDGPGIEVHGNNTVASAPHGKRVVELDSHGAENTNSTMSQDVLLCRGKHVIRFMYYPRTKTQGDNIIEVSIGDKIIKSIDMVKSGNWIRVRVPFRVKEKKSYKISFAAKGKDNSLGGLVDKIRLHKRKRRAGVVTSLISLGDQDNISSPLIRREIASAIIRKSVNFASIKKKPKVLFVKDSRHGNESLDDFVLTESILKELFGETNVSVWSEDLRIQNAAGYDVIYVINPGYPLGSSITADTLMSLKSQGDVGIVFHGDDLARGRNFALNELTGLKYKSNGTSACGIRIDNNKGNKYSLKLRKRFFKKLSTESRLMEYANDIDHTEVLNKRVRILAMAKAPEGCDLKVPAIVGYKLDRPKKDVD